MRETAAGRLHRLYSHGQRPIREDDGGQSRRAPFLVGGATERKEE